ncbi:hypothetical protein T492DRAFT_1039030 [Pavlovales sp. CCMP2436]|nr:hypothetical protein T492DRAFT_1039030 [Pavlovales sp. CCMP2436]
MQTDSVHIQLPGPAPLTLYRSSLEAVPDSNPVTISSATSLSNTPQAQPECPGKRSSPAPRPRPAQPLAGGGVLTGAQHFARRARSRLGGDELNGKAEARPRRTNHAVLARRSTPGSARSRHHRRRLRATRRNTRALAEHEAAQCPPEQDNRLTFAQPHSDPFVRCKHLQRRGVIHNNGDEPSIEVGRARSGWPSRRVGECVENRVPLRVGTDLQRADLPARPNRVERLQAHCCERHLAGVYRRLALTEGGRRRTDGFEPELRALRETARDQASRGGLSLGGRGETRTHDGKCCCHNRACVCVELDDGVGLR